MKEVEAGVSRVRGQAGLYFFPTLLPSSACPCLAPHCKLTLRTRRHRPHRPPLFLCFRSLLQACCSFATPLHLPAHAQRTLPAAYPQLPQVTTSSSSLALNLLCPLSPTHNRCLARPPNTRKYSQSLPLPPSTRTATNWHTTGGAFSSQAPTPL